MVKNTIVAVAGNPNSGKTTLFNGLTGSKQRIGNWPGVTVEKKEGSIVVEGKNITLVDLPGVYSLSAHSEDEKVARDFILNGEIDLVLNIVDATNLERNLYLTTQLLDMKVPVLLAVNMQDLADKKGVTIDLEKLEKTLGCPVIGISAINQGDINKVKAALLTAIQKSTISDIQIKYPQEIEDALIKWSPLVEKVAQDLGTNPRWVAIKLLEQDQWITEKVSSIGNISVHAVNEEVGSLERILDDNVDAVLADYRFRLIQDLLQKTRKALPEKVSLSDKVDGIVMHRAFGIPIFLGVMYLMFWVTISIGGAFIDFFDILFGTIFVDGFGEVLAAIGSPEWLIVILAGGVGAGIQTVSTFVPIVFTMFLMLSLLEDSGYMARAAFVMDRFLRWIGLPGKSFVPMLVGFGCTVPAIMATRTLESKKDRFMTVFMAPFMSCGARLPVYALFGAAFFGASAGTAVFSLYLVGIILAIFTGLLLKNTLFKGEPSHFIMELPPYHTPKIKNILTYTWHRLKIFMLRAGKAIVIVVLILSFLNSVGTDGTFGNEDNPKSVLSSIGKGITPVFEPMGIEEENWPATVAIFTGIFAKEVVVGTLNSLYSQIDAASAEADEEAEEEGFDFLGGVSEAFASIPEALGGVFGGLLDPLGLGLLDADPEELAEELEADSELYGSMQNFFSKGPLQAYAYLLFILIYFPCVAAFATVIREIGKGYGFLLMTYLTVLAWIVATIFYQITLGRDLVWIVVPIVMLIGIAALFRYIGKNAAFTMDSNKNMTV